MGARLIQRIHAGSTPDPRRIHAGSTPDQPAGIGFPAPRAERPYGIEASLRDDSGNMISLTQAFAQPQI